MPSTIASARCKVGFLARSPSMTDLCVNRAHLVSAMYKLQNQNEKDQLSKFFYGLVRPTPSSHSEERADTHVCG